VEELIHSATIAVAGQVPVSRLWHAVPCFPFISEVWLGLLEALSELNQALLKEVMMTREASGPEPTRHGQDVLGGPDPAEWEDELGGPDRPAVADTLGGPDPAEWEDVLGGPA
jgi:hypothetical protein